MPASDGELCFVSSQQLRACTSSVNSHETSIDNDSIADPVLNSYFDSYKPYNDSGAWVLNEAFREKDEDVDYYRLRQGVMEMQESLLRKYQMNRGRMQQEMASRVQSFPDEKEKGADHDAMQSTAETKALKRAVPLRRPGPDTDEKEEGDYAVTLHRLALAQSSHHKPFKPIRGPCQCCFEEVSSTNSISCVKPSHSSSHMFCKDCLRRYVQEWVFGGADYQLKRHHTSTLPCMASDCQDGYIPHEIVEAVCSEGLWENYQEKIFREEALPILAKPPRELIGTLASRSYSDPIEVVGGLADEIVSHAQLKERRSSSAGNESDLMPSPLAKQPHKAAIPFKETKPSHSEKEDKLTKSFNKVAEAMTKAKVRKCPMCDMSYLKESGCNKMKCPGCKTYMCYICRLPVPKHGYGKHLHCTPLLCLLQGSCSCSLVVYFSLQITFANTRMIRATDVTVVLCGLEMTNGSTMPM